MMASERSDQSSDCNQVLEAIDKDDFYDENAGGMTSDEEDALDRELGLTDDISRYVFHVILDIYRLHSLRSAKSLS